MKIIKRSGTEVKFDIQKIVNAISAANADVDASHQLSEDKILELSRNVEKILESVDGEKLGGVLSRLSATEKSLSDILKNIAALEAEQAEREAAAAKAKAEEEARLAAEAAAKAAAEEEKAAKKAYYLSLIG